MKKTILSIVAGVLCALTGFSVLGLLEWPDQAAIAASMWTPYTATKITEHYYGDELKATTVALVARRSDGSFVEFRRLVNNMPDDKRMIVDLVRGQRVSLAPEFNAKTTQPLSTDGIGRLGHIHPCADGEERPTIAGYEVVKSVRTFEGRNNSNFSKTTVETWLAPELNCEAIMRESRHLRPDGTVVARNVDRLTSIVIGEPNAELFMVPPEYTEKAPSEILDEDRKQRGLDVEFSAEYERTRQALDESYRESQNNAKSK